MRTERAFAAALLLIGTACAARTPPSKPETAQAQATPPAVDERPSPIALLPEASKPADDVALRATLTGTVTYVLRTALTPEALLQVELRDASEGRADDPPIARQVLRRPGQVPIAFALEYDPSAILAGRPYAVSARIMDRGQLQFVTEASVAVITRGAPASADIVVVPVR